MYDKLIEALRLCVKYGKAQDALENAERAADAIEKLQKSVLRFEEESGILDELPMYQQPVGWIPVTERLPKYGTPVLAYGSRGGIFVAKYERARAEWDRDYWWKLNSSIHVCNPTHWMPLPEPPKGEKIS